MKDGLHFTKREKINEQDCLVKHTFLKPIEAGETLVNLSELRLGKVKIDIDDYEFNGDDSKILFTTNTESVYRRSFFANYLVYDLKTKQLQELDSHRSPQMLAEYSPDGMQVSYLFENNLYVKELSSGKVKQITKDGKHNAIINGFDTPTGCTCDLFD